MDSQRLELDLHRLELRFASSRLVEPRAVARIAHSIERCGQIVPCVVVAVPGGPGAACRDCSKQFNQREILHEQPAQVGQYQAGST